MILACAIVSNLCPGEKEEMWVLLLAIAVLVFGVILLETIEKKRGPKQIKKPAALYRGTRRKRLPVFGKRNG